MKEILEEVERWRGQGEKVVVATVVATRRSAPRPVGTSLAVSESGQMCGSVSGGFSTAPMGSAEKSALRR